MIMITITITITLGKQAGAEDFIEDFWMQYSIEDAIYIYLKTKI